MPGSKYKDITRSFLEFIADQEKSESGCEMLMYAVLALCGWFTVQKAVAKYVERTASDYNLHSHQRPPK